MANPNHFLSYPSCHRSNNDCFIDHLREERFVNLKFILDDVFYIDDLPKFDQYDDDYVLQIEASLTNKSKVGLWKEEVHF